MGRITAGSRDFGKQLLEAHWAYGHLHFKKLRKLLGLKPGNDPDCAACTIALSRQHAMSKERYDRSTRVNHRKHLDIGFTKTCLISFQLAVDDYTREGYLDVLDSKKFALESFDALQRQHNNEYAPYKLAVLRCDVEPLYDNPTWDKWCNDNDVKREFSGRYRHEQNGVVERAIDNRCVVPLHDDSRQCAG